MTLLNRYNWKNGAKVVLTHPDPSYSIGPANPKQGTEYACDGILTQAGGSSCHVDWRNGCSNGYKEGELSLAEESASGNCGSIWNNIPFDDF